MPRLTYTRMREMPHSWKLHLTAFWLAFVCVCLVALVVGWNATSVGAQLHPMGAVMVDESSFDATIRDNHLVYVNAAAQENVYILMMND